VKSVTLLAALWGTFLLGLLTNWSLYIWMVAEVARHDGKAAFGEHLGLNARHSALRSRHEHLFPNSRKATILFYLRLALGLSLWCCTILSCRVQMSQRKVQPGSALSPADTTRTVVEKHY
jgi:hypothetical protein